MGQFGFLFSALKVGVTAALASALMQTHVFFTALFSFFLLHEPANRTLQAGLLLAARGLGCFAMNYIAPHSGAARDKIRPEPGRSGHVCRFQHRGAPAPEVGATLDALAFVVLE